MKAANHIHNKRFLFGPHRFFSPQILEKKRKESKTIKHLAIRFWSGYQNWCMLCTYTRDAYANRATLLSTESAIAFLETKAGQSVCTVYNKHPSIIVCNRLGKKTCNVATLLEITRRVGKPLSSPEGSERNITYLKWMPCLLPDVLRILMMKIERPFHLISFYIGILWIPRSLSALLDMRMYKACIGCLRDSTLPYPTLVLKSIDVDRHLLPRT